MILKRIISKLISRVGFNQVKKSTAKDHLPLLMSVERARRRKANQKERAKLLALLGKRLPEAGEKKTGSDSDSDSDKGEDEQDQQMKGE